MATRVVRKSGGTYSTIQAGINAANAGDVVTIGPGVYSEGLVLSNKHGSAGNYITIRAEDPLNPPIIDPTYAYSSYTYRAKLVETGTHVLNATNVSYLHFKDIKCTAPAPKGGGGWYFHNTSGDVHHIILENIDIYDFRGLSPTIYTLPSEVLGGVPQHHMISFIGYASYPYTCSYIWIKGCKWNNTGSSNVAGYNEQCTYAGKVNHSLIENCEMNDVKYIGFDLIGQGASGAVYANCKPEYIYYRKNVVRRVQSTNGSAGVAFYNDGGAKTIVDGNIVERSLGNVTGVEKWYTDVNQDVDEYVSRNNVFQANDPIGVLPPALQLGVGGNGNAGDFYVVQDKVLVAHNVMKSGTTISAIYLAQATNARILNNVIDASGYAYTRSDASSGYTTGNKMNGNMFYGGVWQPYSWWGQTRDTGYANFAAFKAATGQEANGLEATPVFQADFKLDATSPGYGAAVPITNATNSAASPSTTLTVTVNTGFAFCDGWNMGEFGLAGDVISLQTTSGYVDVQVVGRSGDTLTLADALTWNAGANIFYANARSLGIYQPTSGGIVDPPPPPPPPPPGEVTTNSGFDTELSPWIFTDALGNFVATYVTGRVDIAGSSTPWTAQLMQAGRTVSAGVTYTATFRAKATVPMSVFTQLMHNSDPYPVYNSVQHSLTTEYQTFTYTFVQPANDTDARFRVTWGDVPSSVTISVDQLKLEIVDEEAEAAPVSDGTPADQTAEESTTVNIAAGFTGANLVYQWYNSVGTLSEGGRFSGVASNTLTITGVLAEDAGTYYCVATNTGGSAQSRTMTLTVNSTVVDGVFSMQLDVTASVNDTHASTVDSTYSWAETEMFVGHNQVSTSDSFSAQQVTANADDIVINNTGFFSNSIDMIVGDNSASDYDYKGYVRFQLPKAIPSGATITNFTLELRMYKVGGSTTIRIYADQSSNSAAPTTAATYNSKTKTTAYVDWTPTLTGSYAWYTSVDLSSVLQELVDDYGGLASGAYIGLMLEPTTSGWGGTQHLAYANSRDSGNIPEINVAWDAGANQYNYKAGFRYQVTTTIPASATITRAYLRYRARRYGTTPSIRWYLEDYADVGAWSTLNNSDFLGRTLTTNYATQTPSLTTSFDWYESPDLTAAVQEIIDSYGALSAGEYIAVRMQPASASWPGSQQLVGIRSWDTATNGNWDAQLFIFWSDLQNVIDADFDVTDGTHLLTARGVVDANFSTTGTFRVTATPAANSFTTDSPGVFGVIVAQVATAQFTTGFGSTVGPILADASFDTDGSFHLTAVGVADANFEVDVGNYITIEKTVDFQAETAGAIVVVVTGTATAQFDAPATYVQNVDRVRLTLPARAIAMTLKGRGLQ